MRKTAIFLSLSIGLPLMYSAPSQAIQRKHRPWFSHAASVPEDDRSSSPTVAERVPAAQEKSVESRHAAGTGDQVAHQALLYKGTRYRYGGTTKRGLDCSGLVNRVWEDLKMKKIPRASSALYQSGKPVHLAELRAGDLVFFKNTSRRGISHVGVYTGNNKFVHAAGHAKGVTITKLSDPYYQLHYAGARRLY